MNKGGMANRQNGVSATGSSRANRLLAAMAYLLGSYALLQIAALERGSRMLRTADPPPCDCPRRSSPASSPPVGGGGGGGRGARPNSTEKEVADELRASYSNFLLHLPKAGGYSAFAYLTLDRMELTSLGGDPRVCNHGGDPVLSWPNWAPCWLHSTEGMYSSEPARRFVLLREPVPHVLSMWNYCTGSPKRKGKAKTMPKSLDAWLAEWAEVRARGVECPQFQQGTRTDRGCPGFVCYNPLDLQSTRTRMLGKDPGDLADRFEVVGLTSELERSTCLISIAIHRKVPRRCDCSRKKGGGEGVWRPEIRIAHGVVRHGEDMNVTADQLRAIENITRGDARLYQAAEKIFREQVARVERRYKIKMC